MLEQAASFRKCGILSGPRGAAGSPGISLPVQAFKPSNQSNIGPVPTAFPFAFFEAFGPFRLFVFRKFAKDADLSRNIGPAL
jgi:hypothetical protein